MGEASHRQQAGEEAHEYSNRVHEHQLLLLATCGQDDRRRDRGVDHDGSDRRVMPVRLSQPPGEEPVLASRTGAREGLQQARPSLE